MKALIPDLLDFSKFFVPLAGAVVAWFWNERRRLAAREYARKERRYRALLETLTGFYAHSASPEVRKQFIEEYKRCWLYCDDSVIRAANNAMHAMSSGTTLPMTDRHKVLGRFVLAIRRDLLSRKVTRHTRLGEDEYMHISPGA